MSGGDYSIFVHRPITLTFLAIALITAVSTMVGPLRKRRATWRDQAGLNT
jgi:TctA family transporter